MMVVSLVLARDQFSEQDIMQPVLGVQSCSGQLFAWIWKGSGKADAIWTESRATPSILLHRERF